MVTASKHFVMMSELHEAAGRRVAEVIGVPAAHVCACATAGIALMGAAVMAGDDLPRARQLPDGVGAKLAVPNPGDVLFFHGAVVHGSLPNRSTDRFRRALIGYYGDGLVEVEVARD